MSDADELVGLWESGPFEYGSMEASKLGLYDDGSGWILWENAGHGAELTLFNWRRAGPDTVVIVSTELVSGEWRPDRPGHIFAARRTSVAESSRHTYRLVTEVPPLDTDPVLTLKVDPRLHYSDAFALARREMSGSDRPTFSQ